MNKLKVFSVLSHCVFLELRKRQKPGFRDAELLKMWYFHCALCQAMGYILFDRFYPVMSKIINQHKYQLNNSDELLQAFETLDEEGKGVFSVEEIKRLFTQFGEPFAQLRCRSPWLVSRSAIHEREKLERRGRREWVSPTGTTSLRLLEVQKRTACSPPSPPQRAGSCATGTLDVATCIGPAVYCAGHGHGCRAVCSLLFVKWTTVDERPQMFEAGPP